MKVRGVFFCGSRVMRSTHHHWINFGTWAAVHGTSVRILREIKQPIPYPDASNVSMYGFGCICSKKHYLLLNIYQTNWLVNSYLKTWAMTKYSSRHPVDSCHLWGLDGVEKTNGMSYIPQHVYMVFPKPTPQRVGILGGEPRNSRFGGRC